MDGKRSFFFASVNAKKRRAGFTLIEVMIALTILAVGFLAVAKMQITGLMGNRHAMVLTEGTTWAQDRMESLMGMPFDDALLADTGGTPRVDAAPPDGYTITWTVTDDSPVTDAKLLRLTARWTDQFGKAKTVVLTGVKNNI